MGLSWYEPRRGMGSKGDGVPRDVAQARGHPGEPGRTDLQEGRVTGILGFSGNQAWI